MAAADEHTPTPNLPLSKQDYLHVYEPAEDTFLLLDALDADKALLRSKAPALCVEIGSGSGCVSAFISTLLGPSNVSVLCTDINLLAASATQRTGQANAAVLSPILTPLLASLTTRCKASGENKAGLIDVLLFNPPYVPTTEEEEEAAQSGAGIAGSWAGGATGTRLVDMLIDGEEGGIENWLAPGGFFYLLAIRQNDPPKLVERLTARGLKAQIVIQRKAGGEHLFVIRAQRK